MSRTGGLVLGVVVGTLMWVLIGVMLFGLLGCGVVGEEGQGGVGVSRPVGVRTVGMVGPDDVAGVYEGVREAGVEWMRVQVRWIKIEAERGVYNWDAPYGEEWLSVRQRVESARVRGFRIFANVSGTPVWASEGGKDHSPPREGVYFEKFMAAVVAEFGGVVSAWGLYNEPNYCAGDMCYWSGTPRQYRQVILKAGYDGAKAADPAAVVIAPNTLHKGGDLDIERWLVEGGKWVRPVDVVGVHAYGERSQQLGWVDRFAGWCRERKQCKGFWITEFGFSRTAPLAPDPEPGEALVEVLNRCRSYRLCQLAFVYLLHDPVKGPGEDFGLYTGSGEPKARMRTLGNWIKGGQR